MIPYGHQSISEVDVAAVVEVLHGEWLTSGPTVERFEAELSTVTNSRYAVAFSSGTAALHAACAAANLGPGDVVATSALTFNASAACAAYVGATPLFVDVHPETWSIDLSRLPRGCEGVVVVHYAGFPVDLTDLPYRPRVIIEDASHAIGAVGRDGPVGNCALSDMCTFSFHPVKTITSGEGGAVTTNDPNLAHRLRAFRNHGIIRDPIRPWHYKIEELGFNYRLTDIHAALGEAQLKTLPSFLQMRNAIAARYSTELMADPVRLAPEVEPPLVHGRHLYPILVPDQERTLSLLHASGIGAQVHYIPLYRHPVWAELVARPEDYPVTERIASRIISLPLYPGLSRDDQSFVIDRLRYALGDY